jgi:mRNA interferase MazF
LLVCCPLTNQEKRYPFEVSMEDVLGVSGIALADQIKSLDWKVRKAEKKGHVPKNVLAEVIAKANTLLRIER